jgi:hypothetical protein
MPEKMYTHNIQMQIICKDEKLETAFHHVRAELLSKGISAGFGVNKDYGYSYSYSKTEDELIQDSTCLSE